jgi:hypothetical protein
VVYVESAVLDVVNHPLAVVEVAPTIDIPSTPHAGDVGAELLHPHPHTLKLPEDESHVLGIVSSTVIAQSEA